MHIGSLFGDGHLCVHIGSGGVRTVGARVGARVRFGALPAMVRVQWQLHRPAGLNSPAHALGNRDVLVVLRFVTTTSIPAARNFCV